MNSKVKVTANDQGDVVVISNTNSEWGHIRVTQDIMKIDNNGFARKVQLSALIAGKVEDLASFEWSDEQEIAGKIIVKESLEPFNTKEPERDYKKAGKSEIVCCLDGQPIYRKSFYTFNESATDSETIAHNNGDAISKFYADAKEAVESDLTTL